ncbi:hypothetical protein BKA70DRAFT_1243709 [Coprinopsis sp. MPI-PUGE-AT-0042]|nr:hypothetical protein BKA70DRAFT_1243709 [Coprinopsis sp. MPI-PUGE-AT-0042]
MAWRVSDWLFGWALNRDVQSSPNTFAVVRPVHCGSAAKLDAKMHRHERVGRREHMTHPERKRKPEQETFEQSELNQRTDSVEQEKKDSQLVSSEKEKKRSRMPLGKRLSLSRMPLKWGLLQVAQEQDLWKKDPEARDREKESKERELRGMWWNAQKKGETLRKGEAKEARPRVLTEGLIREGEAIERQIRERDLPRSVEIGDWGTIHPGHPGLLGDPSKESVPTTPFDIATQPSEQQTALSALGNTAQLFNASSDNTIKNSNITVAAHDVINLSISINALQPSHSPGQQEKGTLKPEDVEIAPSDFAVMSLEDLGISGKHPGLPPSSSKALRSPESSNDHEILVSRSQPADKHLPQWARVPLRQSMAYGPTDSDWRRWDTHLKRLHCAYEPRRLPASFAPESLIIFATALRRMAESRIPFRGNIREIKYQCQDSEGAILAVTSPAQLLSLKDHAPLRDWLCKHGMALLQSLRPGKADPLYVVTGTVTSSSWATASYAEPMKAPYDLLILTRLMLKSSNSQSNYLWTREKAKDQCLFLRGFLLTPSTKHTSRCDGYTVRSDGNAASEPNSTTGENCSLPSNHCGGSSDSAPFAPSSKAFEQNGTVEEAAWGFEPREGPEYDMVGEIPCLASSELYPSHMINNQLLKLTDADLAITHDDDWRTRLHGLHQRSTLKPKSNTVPRLPSLSEIPEVKRMGDAGWPLSFGGGVQANCTIRLVPRVDLRPELQRDINCTLGYGRGSSAQSAKDSAARAAIDFLAKELLNCSNREAYYFSTIFQALHHSIRVQRDDLREVLKRFTLSPAGIFEIPSGAPGVVSVNLWVMHIYAVLKFPYTRELSVLVQHSSMLHSWKCLKQTSTPRRGSCSIGWRLALMGAYFDLINTRRLIRAISVGLKEGLSSDYDDWVEDGCAGGCSVALTTYAGFVTKLLFFTRGLDKEAGAECKASGHGDKGIGLCGGSEDSREWGGDKKRMKW